MDEEDLVLPETKDALELYYAPYPFNRNSGNTVRAQDVPLLKSWYLQQPDEDYPIKTRVSHQKLLKTHVLNELRKRSSTNGKKVNF